MSIKLPECCIGCVYADLPYYEQPCSACITGEYFKGAETPDPTCVAVMTERERCLQQVCYWCEETARKEREASSMCAATDPNKAAFLHGMHLVEALKSDIGNGIKRTTSEDNSEDNKE